MIRQDCLVKFQGRREKRPASIISDRLHVKGEKLKVNGGAIIEVHLSMESSSQKPEFGDLLVKSVKTKKKE